MYIIYVYRVKIRSSGERLFRIRFFKILTFWYTKLRLSRLSNVFDSNLTYTLQIFRDKRVLLTLVLAYRFFKLYKVEKLLSILIYREEYLAKIQKRVESYKIEELNSPREGKKLLVLDIDYTLFGKFSL